MKKMINIRNSIITILCITIICLGIGFMVLSSEYKKEKEELDTFDVSFININKSSSVKGSEKEPDGNVEIITNNKEIDMNFRLNTTHDELVYIATIKNKGTLEAEIIDILESPDYKETNFKEMISPVTITLSDIKGKKLKPDEEIELKIVVYYNPSSKEVIKKNIKYKIGIIARSTH